jgi:hypothetical protein
MTLILVFGRSVYLSFRVFDPPVGEGLGWRLLPAGLT